MPLHPNLTSGYGVLILYTQPHTFTFQIDFHTQDRSEERNKIDRKIYSGCKKKQMQKKQKTKVNGYKDFFK